VSLLELFLGSFSCARSAQPSVEDSVSQRKECVSESRIEFREERVRRAHQKNSQTQGASELLNTLEGRMCREGTEQQTELLNIL
jgi:hypothetical protein